MEAYNLQKLRDSAMPMEWGKRSNVDAQTAALAGEGSAINGQSAQNADDEVKALLFFLRPQTKI